MTTYRLFPSTPGPSSPYSYSGPWQAGINWEVTAGGTWFEGYWWWVPTSGDIAAQKFALWAITGNATGTLIPGSVVTSGTLAAGQWNYVPLPTPLPIAIGMNYVACTGWTVVNGMPWTQNQFASGDPYAAGITNGPLFAYSDASGSAGAWYTHPQGLYNNASGQTDPSLYWPPGGVNGSNFWIDVQVSDTAPGGFPGPYRLWPNSYAMDPAATADSAFTYCLGQVFTLSQQCAVNAVWYYSPAGTAQLATECGVWSVTGGGLTGSLLIDNTSPSWSGAAASGWVRAPVSGTLPAGTYKAFVYNGAASPDGWSAKDARHELLGGRGRGERDSKRSPVGAGSRELAAG